MCVSSSSSLAANGSGAMDKRLLKTNLTLVVAIRHSLRLLVGHVVVRHGKTRQKEGLVGDTNLAFALEGCLVVI